MILPSSLPITEKKEAKTATTEMAAKERGKQIYDYETMAVLCVALRQYPETLCSLNTTFLFSKVKDMINQVPETVFSLE